MNIQIQSVEQHNQSSTEHVKPIRVIGAASSQKVLEKKIQKVKDTNKHINKNYNLKYSKMLQNMLQKNCF